jgi:hypothetical protein
MRWNESEVWLGFPDAGRSAAHTQWRSACGWCTRRQPLHGPWCSGSCSAPLSRYAAARGLPHPGASAEATAVGWLLLVLGCKAASKAAGRHHIHKVRLAITHGALTASPHSILTARGLRTAGAAGDPVPGAAVAAGARGCGDHGGCAAGQALHLAPRPEPRAGGDREHPHHPPHPGQQLHTP